MKLYEKLYQLRKARGLTQDELAEALGVSRQAISKWEMGTGVPSIENLVAISDFFGTSLDSLIKDNAPEPESTPTPAPLPEHVPETVTYTQPAQNFARPGGNSGNQNAAVGALCLILSYALATALSYLANTAVNSLLGAVSPWLPYLVQSALSVILSIPLFITMSVVFRCPSHGIGMSFLGIFGASIFSHILTYSQIFVLISSAPYLKYVFAALNAVVGTATYVLFYLAAAGREGFKGRKKYAQKALFGVTTLYLLYHILFGTASMAFIDKFIENYSFGAVSVGQVLYILNIFSGVVDFASECVLLTAFTVFYFAKTEAVQYEMPQKIKRSDAERIIFDIIFITGGFAISALLCGLARTIILPLPSGEMLTMIAQLPCVLPFYIAVILGFGGRIDLKNILKLYAVRAVFLLLDTLVMSQPSAALMRLYMSLSPILHALGFVAMYLLIAGKGAIKPKNFKEYIPLAVIAVSAVAAAIIIYYSHTLHGEETPTRMYELYTITQQLAKTASAYIDLIALAALGCLRK